MPFSVVSCQEALHQGRSTSGLQAKYSPWNHACLWSSLWVAKFGDRGTLAMNMATLFCCQIPKPGVSSPVWWVGTGPCHVPPRTWPGQGYTILCPPPPSSLCRARFGLHPLPPSPPKGPAWGHVKPPSLSHGARLSPAALQRWVEAGLHPLPPRPLCAARWDLAMPTQGSRSGPPARSSLWTDCALPPSKKVEHYCFTQYWCGHLN